ncbi:MAG: bthL [Firmicutes bacterium]|nr:bthL [Bacillota bacterium]
MARYGIVVDIEKCTGCHSCFLACKDEYVGNDYLPNSVAQPESGHKWIQLKEVERGTGTKIKVDYIPMLCQHCEKMPCGVSAPEGAVYRRKDGIVIINSEKAKGCKKIVNACPYGVVYWNEEKNVPQKCTLCAHMLDQGEKTVRCAESCPTGALVFGDLDDPNSPVSKLLSEKGDRAESYKPELGAEPVTKYIGLPKPFIVGEVLLADKAKECVKGAKVTLRDGVETVAEIATDFFGDFEFKDLKKNSDYTLTAEYPGYFPAEMNVKTYASVNVGEIVLKAK